MVGQDFGFCQDFVPKAQGRREGRKFKSLKVREASSSHLKRKKIKCYFIDFDPIICSSFLSLRVFSPLSLAIKNSCFSHLTSYFRGCSFQRDISALLANCIPKHLLVCRDLSESVIPFIGLFSAL